MPLSTRERESREVSLASRTKKVVFLGVLWRAFDSGSESILRQRGYFFFVCLIGKPLSSHHDDFALLDVLWYLP